jgi:hypothetical protein
MTASSIPTTYIDPNIPSITLPFIQNYYYLLEFFNSDDDEAISDHIIITAGNQSAPHRFLRKI